MMNRRLCVALVFTAIFIMAGCSGDGDVPPEGNTNGTDGMENGKPADDGTQQPSDEGQATNRPPTVSSVALDPDSVEIIKDAPVRLTVTASDPDGDDIEYKWAATGGSFDSVEGHRATWRAPELTGSFTVTVTVTDGRGGTTTAQTVFTVTGNQSPVITSLTASPPSVGAGGHVAVAAAAQDPDGDAVTFNWKADGGQITGVGSNVTWIAPDVSPGGKTSYTITLTVDDGQGGTAVDTVGVQIAVGYGTSIFNPVAAETGTVIEDGGGQTGFLRAGDTADNQTMRAFFSFDLSDVRDTHVTEATVRITHAATVGDPFYLPTGLRGIHVFVARYDPGGLPELYLEPLEELTETGLFESPTEFDITKFAQRIGEGSAYSDRMQFLVRFQRETNNDDIADYMEWSGAVVTVTYAPD